MKKIIISNTELENHEYLFENYILGKKTLYIAITDDPNFYDTFRNLTKYYTSSDSYVNKFAFIINDERSIHRYYMHCLSIYLCKELMERIN